MLFTSVAQSCLTLCDPMDCSIPGFPVHHQFSEPTQTMSIESVMPSNHLILCRPLLLLLPIPTSIRVFSNESAPRMRWPKYWSFSFSISPSNEHLGLISFRMDCLDLLAVQGTLKSLLQHHSSKASLLWRSAFFCGHVQMQPRNRDGCLTSHSLAPTIISPLFPHSIIEAISSRLTLYLDIFQYVNCFYVSIVKERGK